MAEAHAAAHAPVFFAASAYCRCADAACDREEIVAVIVVVGFPTQRGQIVAQVHLYAEYGCGSNVRVEATEAGVGQIVIIVDTYLRLEIESPHLVDIPDATNANVAAEEETAACRALGCVHTDSSEDIGCAVGVIAVEGVGDVPQIIGTDAESLVALQIGRFQLLRFKPDARSRVGIPPFANAEEGFGTEVAGRVSHGVARPRLGDAEACVYKQMVVGSLLLEVLVARQL